MSRRSTGKLPKMHRLGYEPKRLRRAKPLCNECGSQPDRVDGPECVRCGLAYAPEAPLKLETEARRGLDWQA